MLAIVAAGVPATIAHTDEVISELVAPAEVMVTSYSYEPTPACFWGEMRTPSVEVESEIGMVFVTLVQLPIVASNEPPSEGVVVPAIIGTPDVAIANNVIFIFGTKVEVVLPFVTFKIKLEEA